MPGHVESPQRIEAIVQKLDTLRLLKDYVVPEAASRAQIEAVHTPSYVALVESFGNGYLDTDTAVNPTTYGCARLAAGGAVAAALGCVESGRAALALVRPPGHHAGPDHGGGFCYFNNVAVAAKVLRTSLPRVASLDF